jgi:hypothetical protein
MLVGLIAEPIKNSLQWRINVLRMERAVALDCLTVGVQRAVLKNGGCTDWQFWQGLTFPGFEYHWDKNREYLYDSVRLYILRLQIQVIQQLRKSVIENRLSPEEAKAKLEDAMDQIHKTTTEGSRLQKRIKALLTKIFC